ncbi:hypothetical protein TNCV_259341 [Trichonephila clavipes]|uniref:Uncharacterized protein n=1 Tax=Trichonephila clavipes TaxID=2585209 RepID=A0A8X6S3M2_TRICX|nr:hypothetical protein TNCV_259341 [Trichonephila clavipes]
MQRIMRRKQSMLEKLKCGYPTRATQMRGILHSIRAFPILGVVKKRAGTLGHPHLGGKGWGGLKKRVCDSWKP